MEPTYMNTIRKIAGTSHINAENKTLEQRILELPYELQVMIWKYRHRQLMCQITNTIIEEQIIDLWGFQKFCSLTTSITNMADPVLNLLLFAKSFNVYRILSDMGELRYST